MSAALAFERVAVVRDGARPLHDVSLAVDPGTRVAILGESGTGKSLILALATGLLPPSEGTVRLFATDLVTLDADALRLARGRCGLALQGGSLIGELSVEDNLLLGIGVRAPRKTDRLQRRIDRLLVDFSLEHIAGRLARHLSTGEQRRVELARAFVRQPELVILDDPLAGADAATSALETQIARQVRARGIAMLLLTQDRALAARLDCAIYELLGGKLVRQLERTPVAAS